MRLGNIGKGIGETLKKMTILELLSFVAIHVN